MLLVGTFSTQIGCLSCWCQGPHGHRHIQSFTGTPRTRRGAVVLGMPSAKVLRVHSWIGEEDSGTEVSVQASLCFLSLRGHRAHRRPSYENAAALGDVSAQRSPLEVQHPWPSWGLVLEALCPARAHIPPSQRKQAFSINRLVCPNSGGTEPLGSLGSSGSTC